MAPIYNDSARRGRGNGNTGRSRRNAYTNAGVNRGQSSAPNRSHRARGAHRRHANNDRVRAASARPNLASRITYSGARPQDQTRGRAATSHSQDADGVVIYEHPASATLINSHAVSQAVHDPTASRGATMSDLDADDDVDIDIDIATDTDSMLLNNPQPPNSSHHSSLFYGSQPTQPTDPLPSSTPPIPPPSTPRSLPIRILNDPTASPRRPVNTYRGKDPIKRLVQNKKLQAIFADRPVPKERKKPVDERMELRMGMSRVMK